MSGMNENGRNSGNDSGEKGEQEIRSALDELNAAFLQKTEQERSTEKTKNDRNLDILSVILTAVIILTAILIIYTLVRENLEQYREVQMLSESIVDSSSLQDSEPDTEKAAGEDSAAEDLPEENEEYPAEPEADTDDGLVPEDVPADIPAEYQEILTEQEQLEWKEKETDPTQVFIQINKSVDVRDMTNVGLRFINPPYSAYGIQLKIYQNDLPDQILYQSEVIEPGTILNQVAFLGTVIPGSHAATAEYMAFDKEGNVIGTYNVDLTIEA